MVPATSLPMLSKMAEQAEIRPGETAAARGRRLAWSTAIFSLATGLSRILGLIREIVAAYYFGAAGKINAFTVAFQVPNLVRALVADAALSSAFVPVFSELLEKGDRRRAWRVASSLFWLMLLGLGALTALFIVLAPWLLRPFGDPGGDRALAVGLSRVLFPIVALLGVSGIVVGILNSYEHFAVPALTPVFWNLAIIVGLVIGVPQAHSLDTKLYVYAISIVVGTVIQVLLPIPWLRGLDDRLRVVIDWHDPAVRRVLKLMVPVTLGLGLINFNAVVDSAFASRLIDPNLAPTAIDKAFRLYMLPQGMFSVAIATVLFPSLARLAARGDLDGFRRNVGLGLRQIAFLLIPAGVVSAVLADPITRIVYQRGAWGPHETAVTAGALAAFSGGLVFNGAMLMLNRAFFSLQSNWIPTLVALGNLGLNAALDAAFYRFGTWGIPLSTSLVNIAGTVVLLWLLRRRLARIELVETAASTGRIVIASAVLGGIAFGVWYGLDQALGRSFGGQLVSVAVALTAGTAGYLFSCRLLRVRELNALLALRSRFKRA
ncbi:MAG: murein biosynthesis integral membrane protein MurJ [Actinobacteria bacterium]|nr:MAG: murein biosynthesis integral membrane protein MurJ [Actinomycetota bacterium]